MIIPWLQHPQGAPGPQGGPQDRVSGLGEQKKVRISGSSAADAAGAIWRWSTGWEVWDGVVDEWVNNMWIVWWIVWWILETWTWILIGFELIWMNLGEFWRISEGQKKSKHVEEWGWKQDNHWGVRELGIFVLTSIYIWRGKEVFRFRFMPWTPKF